MPRGRVERGGRENGWSSGAGSFLFFCSKVLFFYRSVVVLGFKWFYGYEDLRRRVVFAEFLDELLDLFGLTGRPSSDDGFSMFCFAKALLKRDKSLALMILTDYR